MTESERSPSGASYSISSPTSLPTSPILGRGSQRHWSALKPNPLTSCLSPGFGIHQLGPASIEGPVVHLAEPVLAGSAAQLIAEPGRPQGFASLDCPFFRSGLARVCRGLIEANHTLVQSHCDGSGTVVHSQLAKDVKQVIFDRCLTNM